MCPLWATFLTGSTNASSPFIHFPNLASGFHYTRYKISASGGGVQVLLSLIHSRKEIVRDKDARPPFCPEFCNNGMVSGVEEDNLLASAAIVRHI